MRPLLLPLLLVLCSAVPLAAQKPATLVVEVVDSAGRPLPGTRLEVSGVREVSRAGADGVARVEGIAPGSRMLVIARPGFRLERGLVAFEAGAEVRLRALMTPWTVALDTLTATVERRSAVLSRAGFYERSRRATGTFLDWERIYALAGGSMDLAPALRTLRGFTVLEEGGRMRIGSSRGDSSLQGGCLPAIFVDDFPSDQETLDTLLPQDVAGVEAYPGDGSAPAQYGGASAGCGVILVWLRK